MRFFLVTLLALLFALSAHAQTESPSDGFTLTDSVSEDFTLSVTDSPSDGFTLTDSVSEGFTLSDSISEEPASNSADSASAVSASAVSVSAVAPSASAVAPSASAVAPSASGVAASPSGVAASPSGAAVSPSFVGAASPSISGPVITGSVGPSPGAPVCGDGKIEGTEQCDDITSERPCCTRRCTFKKAGKKCGPKTKKVQCYTKPSCDATGSCRPSAIKTRFARCKLSTGLKGRCNPNTGVCQSA